MTKVIGKFKLIDDDSVNIAGTCRATQISIAPAKLIELLDRADEGDGYKVSGQYVFQHVETGAVFTIYDWKATSLYDSVYPSPEDFWSSETPEEFSVGSVPNAQPQAQALVTAIQNALAFLPSIAENTSETRATGTFFLGGKF